MPNSPCLQFQEIDLRRGACFGSEKENAILREGPITPVIWSGAAPHSMLVSVLQCCCPDAGLTVFCIKHLTPIHRFKRGISAIPGYLDRAFRLCNSVVYRHSPDLKTIPKIRCEIHPVSIARPARNNIVCRWKRGNGIYAACQGI